MEIPLKGALGIPRRSPESEEVKMRDANQSYSILKRIMDDELNTLIQGLKRGDKVNRHTKVSGKLLIDLYYANMEILYPKWFNECLKDS